MNLQTLHARANAVGGRKVAVIGSRDYDDFTEVKHFIAALPYVAVVITGGALGVDDVAEESAKRCRISRIVHEPQCPSSVPREVYVRALLFRNEVIAAECDLMMAFRAAGKSNGTDHALYQALIRGKQVDVYGPGRDEVMSSDRFARFAGRWGW